jgi:hypothetical protein
MKLAANNASRRGKESPNSGRPLARNGSSFSRMKFWLIGLPVKTPHSSILFPSCAIDR